MVCLVTQRQKLKKYKNLLQIIVSIDGDEEIHDSIRGKGNFSKSIEGIKLKGTNAFSVQYHPEASPGPHDSRYLFDDFIKTIKQTKNN